ncbi:hypothetical protein [Mucilaginibacter psychrotolerans]|uniref:Secreted protein n=1 Tax=Mucilaginibacter psychrotolerans TaxID=1524096 RepID=A0A4Y8S3X8_9SPHI|nr:hypothetical protein [Mucilaginibacter psychrotolerans]TFF33642.1 hypothetical protein E2R66_25070 [Mucilaginibacter psychrotolerans]
MFACKTSLFACMLVSRKTMLATLLMLVDFGPHRTHETRNPASVLLRTFAQKPAGISWKTTTKKGAKARKSWNFFCAPSAMYLAKNRHSMQILRFLSLHRKNNKKQLKTPKNLRKTQIFDGILANLSKYQRQQTGSYTVTMPARFYPVIPTFL